MSDKKIVLEVENLVGLNLSKLKGKGGKQRGCMSVGGHTCISCGNDCTHPPNC